MSKNDIKPLGAHVLIQRSSAAEVSKGGIVLPETAKDKPKEGRVVSTGNGKVLDSGKRSAFSVKSGDRVIFASWAGKEVKHGRDEFLVMEESDILAVVEE
jgi:chaperonin GroES